MWNRTQTEACSLPRPKALRTSILTLSHFSLTSTLSSAQGLQTAQQAPRALTLVTSQGRDLLMREFTNQNKIF